MAACGSGEEVARCPSTPSTSAPLTPVSSLSDFEDQGEEISLCSDQAQWLEEIAVEHGLHPCCESESEPEPGARLPQSLSDGACLALQRLVETANREPPKVKRQIFLLVRCRRCLQHTRGGEKKEFLIRLPQHHWVWLEGVQSRCKHATIAKTVRIIVDFYMPLCKGDPEFAARLLTRCDDSPIADSDEQSREFALQ